MIGEEGREPGEERASLLGLSLGEAHSDCRAQLEVAGTDDIIGEEGTELEEEEGDCGIILAVGSKGSRG